LARRSLTASGRRSAGMNVATTSREPVRNIAGRSIQVKNRLHLDLRPADQSAEVARLEALGARRASSGQGGVSWVTMTDPDGNEFDVLQPLAPDELPPLHDALGRRISDAPAERGPD
jgi:hypothetical protein